jgi:hypothetical protein
VINASASWRPSQPLLLGSHKSGLLFAQPEPPLPFSPFVVGHKRFASALPGPRATKRPSHTVPAGGASRGSAGWHSRGRLGRGQP